ncbi:MAG: Dam family site-specific DNA-(adenine-N6)-methyltransferase [Magnetospirillum sp. WYHS-4]
MISQPSGIVIPFLKWAGGKRWFCEHHPGLLPKFSGRYIEPFAGSAALFFSVKPDRALLTDLNAELVITYRAVRDEPRKVRELLELHHRQHSREHYYNTRSAKPINPTELAAWFIYLNRTCWNGLYRVNLKNEFNVPIGTKTKVVLDTDNFDAVSNALKRADIWQSDFENTIDISGDGDFVFVDPPYTVKHNLNGFIKYNDKIFSWADQVRLRDAIARATERGALVMVLNANHQSIRELYADLGVQQPLTRASVLAADATCRSRVEELVVRCWHQLPETSPSVMAVNAHS